MMNPEIKAKWVAALRSGDYQQGYGQLREMPDPVTGKRGHCCLGVLCDVLDGVYIETGVVDFGSPDDTCIFNGDDATITGSAIPGGLWQAVGLERNDPAVDIQAEDETSPWRLSQLNDSRYTFGEIATLIETQL